MCVYGAELIHLEGSDPILIDRVIAAAMWVFGPDETQWNLLRTSYEYWSRCDGMWKKGIGLWS